MADQHFEKFDYPPFEINGTTYVNGNEIAKGLSCNPSLFLEFNAIKLKDENHKKTIAFIPARLIAKKLKLDIIKTDNSLTIGDITWKIDQKITLVSLAKQRVFAFEGLKMVRDFATCTGRKGYSTPPGIFRVYKKIKSKHKVTGRPWGGSMYNPVYFNGCVALHGSTEMRKHPSSHGCCRLYYKDADWYHPWSPTDSIVYVIP